MHRTQLVWDLPLRIFHWALAGLVVTSIATGLIGGNALEWHLRSGYAILALLIFRILWGFLGGHHARFANFLRGPSHILRYLRGETPPPAGHNPLGALSVVAMLGLLLVQGLIGLFANDDVLIEGPLYKFVSKDTSDWLTGLHKRNLYPLAALIALHLGAVFYYLLARKDNLIRPMVTGYKLLPATSDAAPGATPGHARGSMLLATILLLLSSVLVWWVVTRR